MRKGIHFLLQFMLISASFSNIIFSQIIEWQQTNGPFGGIVVEVAVSPSGNIFAVTGSKIFKSTDKGTSWNKTGFVTKEQIVKIVINSSGDIFAAEYRYISKSTDDGNTWSKQEVCSEIITNIVLDSLDNIFFTAGNKIYSSSDNGSTWSYIQADINANRINSISINLESNYFLTTYTGIFRSTDKGITWIDVTNGLNNETFSGIKVMQDGKIFVGTLDKIFSSTNFGASWNPSYLSGGNGFKFEIDSSGNLWASNQTSILRTSNQGVSWSIIKYFSNQSISAIRCGSDGYVFCGGLDGVVLSKDNGVSWENNNNGLIGTNTNHIESNRKGNILINDDHEINISTDNGNIWTPLNAKSIVKTAIYSLTLDTEDGIYLGDFGGVCISRDEGNTWLRKNISSDQIRYLTSESNKIFAATFYKLFYSTNKGESWDIIKTWEDFAFPKLIVHKNGYLLISRGSVLYKSSDNGATWTQISPTISGQLGDFIVTRKGDILVGTSEGLFISSDDGFNWSIKNIIPNSNTKITYLFETPDGCIYADKLGYGLYSSYDYDSWISRDVWGNRYFTRRLMTVDNNGFLYVSTNGQGVYRSGSSVLKILPPSANALPGDKKAYLTWNKNSSANTQKYRIYGGYYHYPVTLIDSTENGANDTVKTITGLTNNTPYYIVVSAVDQEGNESFSEEITVTPIPAPSIPQLISAANYSIHTPVNLFFKWNKGSYTDFYHFQLSGDSLFNNIISEDSTITDTLIQTNNLLYDTKYFWRVRGKGITEKSEWSDVWSFNTIIEAPSMPAAISPVNNSINLNINQTFSWGSSPRAENYHFQLAKNEDFTNLCINDSTLTDTVQTVLLEHDVRYYWKVKAKNIGGTTQWTAPLTFTTIIDTPDLPVLLYPPNNAVNISPGCILRWKRTERAQNYFLQVSADSAFTDLILNDSLLTDTLKNIAPLVYDKIYYWRLKARNIGGESDWITHVFKTVISPPNSPYQFEPENNSINQPVTLVFKWQHLNDAEKYHLQISPWEDFVNPVINDSTIADTSKEITGLNNSILYFWRVKASNIGGNSNWSDKFNFKTIVAIPASPVLLSPANGSKNQPKELELKWNPAQDAETYRLVFYEDSSNIIIDDSTIVELSKKVSGLKSGIKYFWKVNAKNYAGPGVYSQLRNFITILEVPDSLKAEASDFKKVYLNWIDKSNNELGFVLERILQGEPGFRLVDSLSENETSYIDTTVSGGLIYRYRIKSYTQFVSSAYSSEAAVTTITSVDDLNKIPTEYTLSQNYPNPFNPEAIVKYSVPFESYINVTIYNSLGEVVKELVNDFHSSGYYQEIWNAAALSSGIYFCSIKAVSADGRHNYSTVKKMVLMK